MIAVSAAGSRVFGTPRFARNAWTQATKSGTFSTCTTLMSCTPMRLRSCTIAAPPLKGLPSMALPADLDLRLRRALISAVARLKALGFPLLTVGRLGSGSTSSSLVGLEARSLVRSSSSSSLPFQAISAS
jgi:hypothetical protein